MTELRAIVVLAVTEAWYSRRSWTGRREEGWGVKG